MGRTATYDDKINPPLCKALYSRGLSDAEVAAEFGVTPATIYNWVKKYPRFAAFREEGKSHPNAMVVNALLKRALGYSVEEVKLRPLMQPKVEGKRGRGRPKKPELEVAEIIKKEIPPDVNACEFWVRSKMPKDFPDKQNVVLDANITTRATDMTPEERIKWLQEHGYTRKDDKK